MGGVIKYLIQYACAVVVEVARKRRASNSLNNAYRHADNIVAMLQFMGCPSNADRILIDEGRSNTL